MFEYFLRDLLIELFNQGVICGTTNQIVLFLSINKTVETHNNYYKNLTGEERKINNSQFNKEISKDYLGFIVTG